jgi:hypothetical protein
MVAEYPRPTPAMAAEAREAALAKADELGVDIERMCVAGQSREWSMSSSSMRRTRLRAGGVSRYIVHPRGELFLVSRPQPS